MQRASSVRLLGTEGGLELLLVAAGGSCLLCKVQSADMKSLSPYLHKASMARALLYSTSGRKYPCIQLLGVSHLLLQHYYLATAQCTSSLITTLHFLDTR